MKRVASGGLHSRFLQPEGFQLKDPRSVVAICEFRVSAIRCEQTWRPELDAPACSASRLSLPPYWRFRAFRGAVNDSFPLARLPTARTIELTRCLSPDQSRFAIASNTPDFAVGGSR